MNENTDPKQQRIQEEWDDLLREQAELNAGIAADQSAIAKKEDRLRRLREYMTAFRSFHFGENQEETARPVFEPGRTSPIPMRALGMMESYQEALKELGTASPGGYLHGRTASRWLIDAGILEGMEIDQARMRVNKFMARSTEWEPVEGHRGWFRYLFESDPENRQDVRFQDSDILRNDR